MTSINSIFFYGFFKNSNNPGKALISEAIHGMNACVGQVHGVKLVDDYFAAAVLERPGFHIQGQVLTCADQRKWREKLNRFDQIQGYNSQYPERSMYQRSIIKVELAGGTTQYCYIYHKEDADETVAIEGGDWSKIRH